MFFDNCTVMAIQNSNINIHILATIAIIFHLNNDSVSRNCKIKIKPNFWIFKLTEFWYAKTVVKTKYNNLSKRYQTKNKVI